MMIPNDAEKTKNLLFEQHLKYQISYLDDLTILRKRARLLHKIVPESDQFIENKNDVAL